MNIFEWQGGNTIDFGEMEQAIIAELEKSDTAEHVSLTTETNSWEQVIE